jgi:outer membrane protein OmpA-like peptidoglycan-associated protein
MPISLELIPGSFHLEDVAMKPLIFVTLLLSLVLALPALAQQTNSTSGAQPMTSAGQTPLPSDSLKTTPLEPLEPVSSGDFWDGDDPNLANLIGHSLTRKKYVQRQVAPIRDRLNELDELTTVNTQMIKDVDAHAQQGIQQASQRTNEADQHATDAANKAQMAILSATQVTNRVGTVEQTLGSADQYKAGAQTEIRFHPGQSVLSKDAKEALDQMAAPLENQRNYIIEVQGFASGTGHAAIANSRKMADEVVRYLVLNYRIPVYRMHVLGMGNASTAGETAPKHNGGRVEVSLLKNDLAASAQQ